MNLVEQRVVDFVAATASKEPTPGGDVYKRQD